MKDVEIYTIDDKEYMLLNKITKNEETYLYFSNVHEGNDFIIRKLDKEDNEYMIPLNDEDEVKKAILLLTNKELEA